MRVVAFEHDVVHANAVTLLEPGLVGDEAPVDVLAEQLRGQLVGVDVAPVLVPTPGVVDAFQQVRHPADAALGQGDFEVGELVEHVGHQQVDGGHHRVQPVQRDADEHVAVRRESLRHAAGAEVQGQRKFGFLADAQQRIPMVGVKRRQSDLVRRLDERNRLRALGRGALDLGDRGLDIPERNHHQRDLALGGIGTPLIEDEVVVGADAQLGEVLVLGGVKRAAGEAAEVREA